MLHKSQPRSAIVFICTLCALMFSAGCAALHAPKTLSCRLKIPFHHGDITILGWEYPLEGAGRGVRLMVTVEGSPVERRVSLQRGVFHHGLRLDRLDSRIDDLSDRTAVSAPVITTNISLESKAHVPKRYLILQDLSGYSRAFYSDVPNPPLRRNHLKP
jgi:hypothetical protein